MPHRMIELDHDKMASPANSKVSQALAPDAGEMPEQIVARTGVLRKVRALDCDGTSIGGDCPQKALVTNTLREFKSTKPLPHDAPLARCSLSRRTTDRAERRRSLVLCEENWDD